MGSMKNGAVNADPGGARKTADGAAQLAANVNAAVEALDDLKRLQNRLPKPRETYPGAVRLHMLCDSREAFVKGGSGSVAV